MVIATDRDARRLLAPLFAGATEERLAILHLDSGGRAIAVEEKASGDLVLRDILRAALQRDSAGLVVAHNHPSGDPRPSPEDIDVTRALAEIGARLGIRLHDHLIFVGEAYSSFRALGLL
ncbi:MAG TPA: JAB domain-containing protein [Allosphingosinicella sp.]|nr:JAB domain-containing protein [Allosphingosinicella sp.]